MKVLIVWMLGTGFSAFVAGVVTAQSHIAGGGAVMMVTAGALAAIERLKT